jgi:hypothetical protein
MINGKFTMKKILVLFFCSSFLLFSCSQARGQLEWRTKKYTTYSRLTYTIVLFSLGFVSLFLSGGGDRDMVVASYEEGSKGYTYINMRFGSDTYLAVATDGTYVLIFDDSDGINRWYILHSK